MDQLLEAEQGHVGHDPACCAEHGLEQEALGALRQPQFAGDQCLVGLGGGVVAGVHRPEQDDRHPDG